METELGTFHADSLRHLFPRDLKTIRANLDNANFVQSLLHEIQIFVDSVDGNDPVGCDQVFVLSARMKSANLWTNSEALHFLKLSADRSESAPYRALIEGAGAKVVDKPIADSSMSKLAATHLLNPNTAAQEHHHSPTSFSVRVSDTVLKVQNYPKKLGGKRAPLVGQVLGQRGNFFIIKDFNSQIHKVLTIGKRQKHIWKTGALVEYDRITRTIRMANPAKELRIQAGHRANEIE